MGRETRENCEKREKEWFTVPDPGGQDATDATDAINATNATNANNANNAKRIPPSQMNNCTPTVREGTSEPYDSS